MNLSPLRIALTLLPELEQHVKMDGVTALLVPRGLPARKSISVLRTLARAGIVKIHHGAGGGFSLTRPLSEITLTQVMGALQEAAPLEMQDAPIPLRRAFQHILDGDTDKFTLADLK